MPYRVEHASTGRAACKASTCNKSKIPKGELRMGTWVSQFDSWTWRHWGCVTSQQIENLRGSITKDGAVNFDLLDGYDELPTDGEEQAKIRRAVDQGYVDDEDWKGEVGRNRPGGLKNKGERKKAQGTNKNAGKDAAERESESPAKSEDKDNNFEEAEKQTRKKGRKSLGKGKEAKTSVKAAVKGVELKKTALAGESIKETITSTPSTTSRRRGRPAVSEPDEEFDKEEEMLPSNFEKRKKVAAATGGRSGGKKGTEQEQEATVQKEVEMEKSKRGRKTAESTSKEVTAKPVTGKRGRVADKEDGKGRKEDDQKALVKKKSGKRNRKANENEPGIADVSENDQNDIGQELDEAPVPSRPRKRAGGPTKGPKEVGRKPVAEKPVTEKKKKVVTEKETVQHDESDDTADEEPKKKRIRRSRKTKEAATLPPELSSTPAEPPKEVKPKGDINK